MVPAMVFNGSILAPDPRKICVLFRYRILHRLSRCAANEFPVSA